MFAGSEVMQVGKKPIIGAEPTDFFRPIAPETEQGSLLSEKLEAARKEVDTDPTEAQIEAGNYKKGHISIKGLDISIENPKGSIRKVGDKEFPMHFDYGYIKGIIGADKEHIDVYLGPNLQSDQVFVVNQIDPMRKKFDEQKVMLGFDTKEEAKAAYLKQYDRPDFFGSMSTVSMDAFKGRTSKGGRLIDPGAVLNLKAKLERDSKEAYAEQPGEASEITPSMKNSVIMQRQSLFQPQENHVSENKGDEQARKDAEEATRDLTRSGGIQGERGKLWPSRGGVKTLALGIQSDLIQKGKIDLRGQTVRSAEDLAALAQVYRDPRYETFRIFYIKNNQIVSHEGLTSRMPGEVRVLFAGSKKAEEAHRKLINGEITQAEYDHISDSALAQSYFQIRNRMSRLGADGYYFLHNHPSGDPTPSRADILVTDHFSAAIPGFLGHVVIDSGKYAVIPKIVTATFPMKRELKAENRYVFLCRRRRDWSLERDAFSDVFLRQRLGDHEKAAGHHRRFTTTERNRFQCLRR